jgi:ADP-ribose pyrophosphatase
VKNKDLTEHVLTSEVVFDGRLLHVRRDAVRLPDGQQSVREYIHHPGAVVVIPILDNGDLILERQHRYPLHRDFIELPAGKIDSGEETLACAQRELLEETGYIARDWQYVTTVYPCIGYADERLVYYLARGLSYSGHARDDDEFLEVFPLPFEQALEKVNSGEICDVKTVVGLFWLEKLLNGKWTPPAELCQP